jgi:adenylate kinase family enzyme
MKQPRRIAVVGTSGSGKTALAAKIAARLGCPHIELDGIHHLENWTPIERGEMRRIVAGHLEGESWVVDGNYSSLVQDLVFAAAGTVAWLDLPRRVVMFSVTRRTMGRMASRRELWNGNRERFSSLLRTQPEDNIILWSWTQHEKYHQQYLAASEDPTNSHLNWVRLESRRAVREWVRTL